MELSSLAPDSFGTAANGIESLSSVDLYTFDGRGHNVDDSTTSEDDDDSDKLPASNLTHNTMVADLCLSSASIPSINDSIVNQPKKRRIIHFDNVQQDSTPVMSSSFAVAVHLDASSTLASIANSHVDVTDTQDGCADTIHGEEDSRPSVSAGTGMVLMNTPNGPVLNCGGIQLTQQDLIQIQQQLQQKLLNQPVTLTTQLPSTASLPPQQYVILGAIQPTDADNSLLPSVVSASQPQTHSVELQNVSGLLESSIPELQPINLPMSGHTISIVSGQDDTSADSSDANDCSDPNKIAPAPKLYVKRPNPFMTDELANLADLEKFAKHFKQRRVEMGFTQGDVGASLGKSFLNDFSQTTISRFEALNLSFKNMCKLKPLLEQWLVETEQKQSQPINHFSTRQSPETVSAKRRKKRTTIEEKHRELLEKKFLVNHKPNSDQIAKIAEEFNLEKDVVRVWFCNRRQKEKRLQCYQTGVTTVQHEGIPLQAIYHHQPAPLPLIQAQPCAGPSFIISNTLPGSNLTSSGVLCPTTSIQQSHNEDKQPEAHSVATEQILADMTSPKGAALKGFAPPIVIKNPVTSRTTS